MERRESSTSLGTLVAYKAEDGRRGVSALRMGRGRPSGWMPDGSGLVVAARENGVGPLWWISATQHEQRRITNDLLDYRKGSLTSDGKTLVAVLAEAQSSIWIAPIDGKSDAVRVTTGRYDGISGIAAARGPRIVYRIRRQRLGEHLGDRRNGANRRQLTTDGERLAGATLRTARQ